MDSKSESSTAPVNIRDRFRQLFVGVLNFKPAWVNEDVVSSSKFKLGDWVVEPELDRISHGNSQVNLQPQVMNLLVYLAHHHKEVVSNDELLSQLWEDRVVTSNSVYSSLKQLREALGDDAQNPKYIKTIPKRGYRLIAPVEFPESEENPDGPVPGQVHTSTNRPGTTALLLILLSLVAVLIFIIIDGEKASQNSEPNLLKPQISQASIAVLPFLDLSPNHDQEYFSDGITEEILNIISGFSELKVIGRTSSFKYKGQADDLRTIGKQLDVAHILEGSVRRDGQRIRITAQLISVANGAHVWSNSYDTESTSLFAIQDEIARNIAQELKLSLIDDGSSADTPASTVSIALDAHDLLLLAKDLIHNGGPADVKKAVELLEQALIIEPNYARAHAELAYALIPQGLLFVPQAIADDSLLSPDGPVMRHAESALAIDPQLAAAHAIQGMLYQMNSERRGTPGLLDKAEMKFKTALKFNPNSARTRLWYAGLMRNQSRSWNERREQAYRAMELDPQWPFARLFYLQLIKRMPAHRQEKWTILRELRPADLAFAQLGLGPMTADLLWHEGQFANAINMYEEAISNAKGTGYAAGMQPNLNNYWTGIGAFDQMLPTPGPGRGFQHWIRDLMLPVGGVDVSDKCPGILSRPDPGIGSIDSCSFYLLLAGQTEKALQILDRYVPKNLAELDEKYKVNFYRVSNPALSYATIHKMAGNEELAAAYTKLVEDWLAIASENGKIESPRFSRVRAHVLSLRGEHDQAIEELRKTIDMGTLSWAMFMHPVFNEIRDDVRFVALLERYMGLVNIERVKLGLDPAELNYAAGPGVIPFKSDAG